MNDVPHHLHLVRRMALISAALMLATITLSAFMRLSQAGLGCEPWPACYAQSARDAAQGVAATATAGHGVAAARLAHRVVASVVLILAITMVLSTWLTKPALQREGRLAAGALALAVGLAVLGIVTPGARVPAVALGNLLGGFLMLALCVRLATTPHPARPGLGGWALATALMLLLQVALGAIISGSHAALACSDVADCAATARAAGGALHSLNPWHVPALEATLRVNPAGALVQLIHRGLAPLVLVAVLMLGLQARRRGHGRSGMLVWLLGAGVLAVGLVSVASGLPLVIVLLHNALAALLLAAVVRLI
jgi:cytochrome c oxidase assembly protein subunit 15